MEQSITPPPEEDDRVPPPPPQPPSAQEGATVPNNEMVLFLVIWGCMSTQVPILWCSFRFSRNFFLRSRSWRSSGTGWRAAAEKAAKPRTTNTKVAKWHNITYNFSKSFFGANPSTLNILPDFFVAKTDEKILVPLEEEEEEEEQTSKELSPPPTSKEKEDREVKKKDENWLSCCLSNLSRSDESNIHRNKDPFWIIQIVQESTHNYRPVFQWVHLVHGYILIQKGLTEITDKRAPQNTGCASVKHTYSAILSLVRIAYIRRGEYLGTSKQRAIISRRASVRTICSIYRYIYGHTVVCR